MARIQFLGLFQAVKFVLFHVEGREVQQLFLLSFKRYGYRCVFFWQCHGEWQYDLLCPTQTPAAHFDDAQAEQFLVAFVQFLLIFKGKSLIDRALRDVQEIDESHVLLAYDIEHVQVLTQSRDHLAASAKVLYKVVFLFHGLGLLKAQFGGEALHFLLHGLRHFCRIAFKNVATGGDVAQVFVVRLFSNARSFTAMNVVVEAYFIFAAFNAFLCHDSLAGTGLVEFAAQVEQGVHCRNMAVRTEISSSTRAPPCLENARQVFVSNRNGRVGLVVFEQYVVTGFVAFD